MMAWIKTFLSENLIGMRFRWTNSKFKATPQYPEILAGEYLVSRLDEIYG